MCAANSRYSVVSLSITAMLMCGARNGVAYIYRYIEGSCVYKGISVCMYAGSGGGGVSIIPRYLIC